MKTSLTLLAVGLATLFAAAPAAAHGGVGWSVTITSPGYYGAPPPVVYAPPPIVYAPPPVVVQPRPAYVQPQPSYVLPPPVYVPPATVWEYREFRGHPGRNGHWHDRYRGDRGWRGDHGRHRH